MGLFFSKKHHQSRVTEQDKAVLQLKQTRDKIKQYQRRIEQNIERDREIAKKLVKNGRKERALSLLRKKKFQEQILIKTDSQLENLESLVHDLEFAQIEMIITDGLKSGNVALKKLHDILSISEIEKVMDETKEGIEKQQEIDELLSGELTAEDESEVEIELTALIEQEMTEVMPEIPENILLPDVPDDEVKKQSKERSRNASEPVALEA